jgi:transcriptional regulator with XRE-family HTH domain
MNNLGLRLKQARKARGLSLRALAGLVNLSHAAIKKYEDGTTYPSSNMQQKIANALNVSMDFFTRPVKVATNNVRFRKQVKGKSEEALTFEVLHLIERRLELENVYPVSPVPRFAIPTHLPLKINNYGVIESITEQLRSHWKLGLAPIHSLIDTLERQGIRILLIEHDDVHFEGLSTIINHQPLLVASSCWPGDQQRFFMARELGYTLLVNRLATHLDEELACNRFAGAFLFPREAVFQAFRKERQSIEWQELHLFKEQFQLSMRAICDRLKELGVIQNTLHESLTFRFRQKGWHRREPGLAIPPEKAHTFNHLLFQALGEEYLAESEAVELLACTLTQLKALRQMHDSPE